MPRRDWGYVPRAVRPLFRWILFWRRLSAPTVFLLSFVLLILFGALLDALFTTASAVTVTGLTVVDTATHFTGLGQLWLLVCMQLGGIGLITLTTTLAVIIALGMSRFRSKRFVEIKERAIPQGTIERTIGVVLLFIAVLIVSFFVLGAIQGAGRDALEARGLFLPIAFETLSAFTTTGLTMGSTADLTYPSTLVLIVLMFIGRVGLFSFFAAVILQRSQPPAFVRSAQEDVIVG